MAEGRKVQSRLLALFLAAAAWTLGASPSAAQGLGRIEIHPLETLTVSDEQFLTGDKAGKPVRLAGELRLPRAQTERFPAVILVHGSGGISAATDRWAQELNGIGVAAFIMDSFTGRGITRMDNDHSQLSYLSMVVDAYRALALLAEHPRIDRKRIAIMGFSWGAGAAVYSSVVRFKEMWGPSGVDFVAHIGFYALCNVIYRDDRVAPVPIRLFHGIADDMVPITPCRAYVERLKKTGADVSLTEYPGAYHAFDFFTLNPPIMWQQAETTRNCLLREGANGRILNAKTGAPFDYRDPCVERGAHFGYNAAAYEASVAAVKAFLVTRFGPK